MDNFLFEVYTPYRLFYKGEVEYAVLSLTDGEIGIYANHTPFTAPVATCILRFKEKKGEVKYALISDGIIEVKKSKTVVLSDSANWPDEIDMARAEAARAETEKIIADNNFKLDTEKAKKKLKRAQIRIKLHNQMRGLMSREGNA